MSASEVFTIVDMSMLASYAAAERTQAFSAGYCGVITRRERGDTPPMPMPLPLRCVDTVVVERYGREQARYASGAV